MIQHLLITRFNLRISQWCSDKRGEKVLDDAWVRERLLLFEHFCLASVRGQSRQDFRWLVLLDEDSTDFVRDSFARLCREYPRIEPVFLPPIESDRQISAAIGARVSPRTEVLATTRLDNDDALRRDFFETLRRSMRGNRREFLNPRFGYTYFRGEVQVMSHRYSPFVTLVEPATQGPFVSVHCGLPHGRSRRLAPVRQLPATPYWIHGIHGRNLANCAPGERRRSNRGLPRRLAGWVKSRLLKPIRRQFWPADWRRPRPFAEIAADFSIEPDKAEAAFPDAGVTAQTQPSPMRGPSRGRTQFTRDVGGHVELP